MQRREDLSYYITHNWAQKVLCGNVYRYYCAFCKSDAGWADQVKHADTCVVAMLNDEEAQKDTAVTK